MVAYTVVTMLCISHSSLCGEVVTCVSDYTSTMVLVPGKESCVIESLEQDRDLSHVEEFFEPWVCYGVYSILAEWGCII